MAWRVEIGIGVEKNKDGDFLLSSPQRINHAIHAATDTFGGCAVTHVDGGWNDPKTGEYVPERGIILRIDAVKDLEKVRFFARCLKADFDQQSVVFSYQEVVTEFL